MEEVWRDVVGYEDAYQVSNFGRVRSKDRIIVTERYKNRHESGKIIKQRKDKDGYRIFNAKWCGTSKMLKVHREVAKCFIDNPEKYPCIDHIDGIRDNNVYTNLRWCTNKQNANFELAKINKRNAVLDSYMDNDALRKIRAETFRKAKSKKVSVYFNGNFIGIFDSQRAAAKRIKISESSISAFLNGRIKNCKGYAFKTLLNE